MQKKRQPTKEYLIDHPLCCYCNGRKISAERDHAPARVIFKGKQAPEDHDEFPACRDCNGAASLSEQVAAFYFRAFDLENSPLDEVEFKKLIDALVNNAPNALPTINTDRLSREAQMPPVAKRFFEVFALKMLYAMHYKTTGKPAGPHQRRIATWAQSGTPAAQSIRESANAWFDKMIIGQRRNVDLGNQFRYQIGHNPAHGYLGLHMSFGESFVFFCALGPAREMIRLKPKPPLWTSIAAMGNAIKSRR